MLTVISHNFITWDISLILLPVFTLQSCYLLFVPIDMIMVTSPRRLPQTPPVSQVSMKDAAPPKTSLATLPHIGNFWKVTLTAFFFFMLVLLIICLTLINTYAPVLQFLLWVCHISFVFYAFDFIFYTLLFILNTVWLSYL